MGDDDSLVGMKFKCKQPYNWAFHIKLKILIAMAAVWMFLNSCSYRFNETEESMWLVHSIFMVTCVVEC